MHDIRGRGSNATTIVCAKYVCKCKTLGFLKCFSWLCELVSEAVLSTEIQQGLLRGETKIAYGII